eukprot:UN27935
MSATDKPEDKNDDEMNINDYEDDNIPFTDKFQTGVMVELHGLSNDQFNKLKGEIKGQKENGRFLIDVGAETKKYLAIKPANLQVCEDQKLEKGRLMTKILSRDSRQFYQNVHRRTQEQQQQQALYLMGAVFTFLICMLAWNAGAFHYIYLDSPVAPYLQTAYGPVHTYVVLPGNEYVVQPSIQYV